MAVGQRGNDGGSVPVPTRGLDALAAAVTVASGAAAAITAPSGVRTLSVIAGAALACGALAVRRRRSAAWIDPLVAVGVAVVAVGAAHAFLAVPALVACGIAAAGASRGRVEAGALGGLYGVLLATVVLPDGDRPEVLTAVVLAVALVPAGVLTRDAVAALVAGRRRAGFSSVLRDATERLVVAHDLQDVYRATVDGALATLPPRAEAGDERGEPLAAVLRDDAGRLLAGRGGSLERATPRDVVMPASVEPALRSQRTVVLDGGAAHELLAAIGADGPRAHVLVSPMVQDDRVHGVLVAGCAAAVEHEAVEALDVLADTAALAIAELQCTDALSLSDARFRSLVTDSADVIAVTDVDGGIHYLSPSAVAVLGAPPEELVRSPLQDLCHPDDVRVVEAFLARTAGLHDGGLTLRARLRHRDGSWRTVELRGRRLRSGCGDDCPYHGRASVEEVVLNLRDCTDRVALERQLAHQALHDPLTELPNRALLFDRLRQALLPDRHPGQPVALLLIDLDDFKSVNDGFGHVRGDTVLREVAQRLQGTLRPGDTAARLGGDEFAIVVPGARGGVAEQVADRVLEHLEEPFLLGAHQVPIGASIGIAVGTPGSDPTELVRQADVAMYAAKTAGGRRWRRFSHQHHAGRFARGQRVAELRDAVDRGEIVVHYQPTIDLDVGAIVGFEALVRWQHPRDGLVAPADFIPLAEESGAIDRIGLHVLADAVDHLAAWNGDGSDRFVSINVSPLQLSSEALYDTARRLLEDRGVRADLLTLEITETALIADLPSVLGRLHQLKRLGVRLAVDDFGTGYSSLRYLEELPVDILKIDRAFVQRLADAPPSPLTQSVLDLGRSLHLETVAEGIERPEQLGALRRLGCDMGQGYLFSRPVPGGDIPGLIADSERTLAAGNGGRAAMRARPARASSRAGGRTVGAATATTTVVRPVAAVASPIVPAPPPPTS